MIPMRKRMCAAILTGTMILGLTACGQKENDETGTDAARPVDEQSEAISETEETEIVTLK